MFSSSLVKVFYDNAFLDYSHSPNHPESPERLRHTVSELKRLNCDVEFMKPRTATLSELLAVHSSAYVEGIRRRSIAWADEETPVHSQTFNIASLAAGASINALETAIETGTTTMALVRPPGHHAGISHGGGFCYFNNVAVAARKANLDRIAIVDIDVHHGNGTSEIFYDTDKVLYVSTHQRGIYPGTGKVEEVGKGDGEGFNLNIPLRAGSGDATFLFALDSLVIPVLQAYAPRAVIVSLGVDSHYLDPLASLLLSTLGYLEVLKRLTETVKSTALILEGGYNIEAVFDVIQGAIQVANGIEHKVQFSHIEDTIAMGSGDVMNALHLSKTFWNI